MRATALETTHARDEIDSTEPHSFGLVLGTVPIVRDQAGAGPVSLLGIVEVDPVDLLDHLAKALAEVATGATLTWKYDNCAGRMAARYYGAAA